MSEAFFRSRRGLGWLLAAALAVGACTGRIGGDDDEPVQDARGPLCSGIEPGPSPIRRMTRAEYDATVRDLLGDTTHPAAGFVVEEEALGFNNQATALGVTQLLAEQYMQAAEGIAERAAADLPWLLGCDPAIDGEAACAASFIASFGRRAYRRPLDSFELKRLEALRAWGAAQYGWSKGVELVVQAMLQSPHFLYRVELGMPAPVERDVVAMTDDEMASRLSYLIWGSMPDEALFTAADEARLRTPEEIAAQARRMLDDPRAREAVSSFHAQWLGLTKIGDLSKDEAIYPTYDPSLRALWKAETERFLEHAVFDEGGDIASMLTASYTFMNHDLAVFYGEGDPPEGDAFVRVELDPTRRSGLLTQASILAVNAKANQSSPVHRGKFVRERLLCQTLPPPPNNVKIEAPEVDPGATTREQFAEHSIDPACSGCHRLMDPIGFGFEHYDGVGLWRDSEHGLPVDATGEVNETRDADGKFDGAIELGAQLAASDEVRQCVATQWIRYGYGRAEAKEDACAVAQIQGAFAAAGYDIRELIVALTQTDAFRYRHAPSGDVGRYGGSPRTGVSGLGRAAP